MTLHSQIINQCTGTEKGSTHMACTYMVATTTDGAGERAAERKRAAVRQTSHIAHGERRSRAPRTPGVPARHMYEIFYAKTEARGTVLLIVIHSRLNATNRGPFLDARSVFI
jgi:hypothetical protein